MQKLAAAIAQASEDAQLRQKLKLQGIEPRTMALQAFDAYIDQDVARLAPLTRGITAKK